MITNSASGTELAVIGSIPLKLPFLTLAWALSIDLSLPIGLWLSLDSCLRVNFSISQKILELLFETLANQWYEPYYKGVLYHCSC